MEVKDYTCSDSESEAKLLAEIYHREKSPLTIGSRAVLRGFFEMNGMSEKADEIMSVISEPDCIDEEAVRQRLINDVKMLPCKTETLLDFVSDKGGALDTVFALEQYCGMVEGYDRAVDDFKATVLMLLVCGVPADMLDVKLTYTGEKQYSGTVFMCGNTSGGNLRK